MPYETSHNAGFKSINHDKNRGKWASPTDFLFVCIGHAFKIDAMCVLPSVIFGDCGVYALLPYFTIVAVCTAPIIFLQSYLGQFSSTGFISAFRISPLFKGIGYASLVMNISTLTYYSIFAAVPFCMFLNSFRPKLPWGCENSSSWLDERKKTVLPCNVSKLTAKPTVSVKIYVPDQLPSLGYFKQHFNLVSLRSEWDPPTTYSWSLMLCCLLTWIIVWLVLEQSTETIGKIIRFSSLITYSALGICLVRLAFLPGAMSGLIELFKPRNFSLEIMESFGSIPLLAMSGLGSGWGSILTMSSYNNFKADLLKNTWVLCLGQIALTIVMSLLWIFVKTFLKASNQERLFWRNFSSQWEEMISIPSVVSLLEMPNFWSLMFFGMLTLGAVNLLVIHFFSVSTSLFDEYECLRKFKKFFTRTLVAGLALGSIFYCSNYGFVVLELLVKYSVSTQNFLHLLLILAVLWIYGRERFQQDVLLLGVNRIYAFCVVITARFLAPLFLLYSFAMALLVVIYHSQYTTFIFRAVTTTNLLPWVLVPVYFVVRIMKTRGTFTMRFKAAVRPSYWFSADQEDKEKDDLQPVEINENESEIK